MQSTSPLTTQSLFVIVTGAINSGKSFQVLTLLNAEVDGRPVATPTLYLLAEASGEGTAGEVINDHDRCLAWPVTDCEDATVAISACFPDSGDVTLGEAKTRWHAHMTKLSAEQKPPTKPPPPPARSPHDAEVLRSLVVDTQTTLYLGSLQTASTLFKEEATRKNRGQPVRTANKKEDPSQNDMNLHGYAARVASLLTDRLNRVTQHCRGTIVLVTVHTTSAIEQVTGAPGEPATQTAVGETPWLGSSKAIKAGMQVTSYSKTWDRLAAKANLIVHAFADAPDYGAVQLADINDLTKHPGITYGLITEKGIYPRRGPVFWVKRQDGAGQWAYLAAMPRYWHPSVACDPAITSEVSATPSIGAMIAYSIRQHHTNPVEPNAATAFAMV